MLIKKVHYFSLKVKICFHLYKLKHSEAQNFCVFSEIEICRFTNEHIRIF